MRTWFIFCLWLICGIPLHAQTDAEDEKRALQLIHSTGLSYYCPRRDGLKGFTCDASFELSDVYKKDFGSIGANPEVLAAILPQKLTVTVDGEADPIVVYIDPPVKNEKDLVQFEIGMLDKDIQHILESCVYSWDYMIFRLPFNEDIPKDHCSVERNANSFTFTEILHPNGETIKYDLDTSFKLRSITTYRGGGRTLLQETSYSLGPLGNQLDLLRWNVFNMTVTVTFSYKRIGNYMLPATMAESYEDGHSLSKGHAVTFEFSNYKLKE
jgi:hypothetical protein